MPKDKTDAHCKLLFCMKAAFIMECCTHVLHIQNGQADHYYRLNFGGIEKIEQTFMQKSMQCCKLFYVVKANHSLVSIYAYA